MKITASRSEYMAVEKEFLSRKDALCENTRPDQCNCGECPCYALCNWLCTHTFEADQEATL